MLSNLTLFLALCLATKRAREQPESVGTATFLADHLAGLGTAMGPEGGRGRGFGSDTITPTRQVIIPATKRAPPPMNTGRTLAHANTFPDRIVSRQELAAAATSTGPRTTMIIPRMKISDLNLSRNPWEAAFLPSETGCGGDYLRLCYYTLALKEKTGVSGDLGGRHVKSISELSVSILLRCGY